MDHSFASALVLLLLVLDPLGGLPIYITIMRGVAPERRHWVEVREVGIAFIVLRSSQASTRIRCGYIDVAAP
jgi:small neutral amino acid transporter SnatA (MarC family)